jgi:hypothetical protein
MPRKRTASKDRSEFTCPECGRTFSRAAALGAHRRQAHGVIGAVSAARTERATANRKTARTRAAGSQSRRQSAAAKPASTAARSRRRSQPAARTTQRAQTGTARAPAARRQSSSNAVNRDALLGALFPNGLPAKEEVLRDANQWLDEAERLARMR